MSTRNKKSPRTPNRLEKKKYNPFLKKHTLHRETRWSHATKDRQTPLRLSTRQSHHAAPPHRYRGGSNRLQESRFAEKVRDRERENFAAANHRHAGAHAPEDHARNQTQPFCAVDEVMLLPPSPAAEVEMPPRFLYRPRRNRPLTEHRLSSLCAQRSFTPLTLAWTAAGRIPAGRTGHRPVFRLPWTARRLSSQWSGLRLRRRSPLVQTPLQVRAIQYFRHAFHLREGVIKMRAYPQPTAVRAINA